MGMAGVYTEASKELIESLKGKSEEELFDYLEEIADDMESNSDCDVDKLWQGIHFLLTGETDPIDGDPVSEFVFGTKTFFDGKYDDYIAYILPEDIQKVVDAVNKIDIDLLLKEFDPQKFAKADVYPNIWMRDDRNELAGMLKETFTDMLSFYQKVLVDGNGIIVSIY
ncbi:MAG: YfbM family protein [Clostridia bacterium]|nr:YfbM family protein [Clostridia bacterium]